MKVHHLKAATYADLHNKLKEAGLYTEERDLIPYIQLAEIGVVIIDDSQVDENGNVIYVFSDGYLANLYGDLTEAQEEILSSIVLSSVETPYATAW